MTDDEAKAFLLGLYDQLIRNTPDAETVSRYMTDDFIAHSDGVTMNREEFEAHLDLMHQKLSSFEVKFKKIVTSPDCIAAILNVDFFTDTESHSIIQVNAFYSLREGKVAGLDEMSRLVSGNEADRGLVARST